jgi:DNA-binding CsgD family transcriptional regulator
MSGLVDPTQYAKQQPGALIGRERERALLGESLDRALTGNGCLVLVGGEAGIGKTTLVDDLALLAARRGALILRGHCYALTTTPPYGPWIEIARTYRPVDNLPPLPDTLQLSELSGLLGSQSALFEEVTTFFASLALMTPVLLVLEDLHWADEASLDLLRHLARQAAGLPLLLTVTYRDDEITRQHPLYQLMPSLVRESGAQRVDLHRLDADAIRELIGQRYQLDPDDEDRLAAYLQDRAEGNPFFAGELLRSLEEEGYLALTDNRWHLRDPDLVLLPPLVRQVIELRLAKLERYDRDLLEIAATIGQVIPLDLWGETSGATEEQLTATLERAIERHVIEETPDRTGLRFTHALMREALYEGLVLPRRRSQHARIAETLANGQNPDPDTVAYHLQQAGDDRAVEWLVRAGDRAQRSYAWGIAAERFRAACSILESRQGSMAERGWLLYRVARLSRFTGPVQSIACFEQAEQLGLAGDDPVLTAYALFDRGVPRIQAGDFRQGIADMEAGLAGLESLPSSALPGAGSRVAGWVADTLPVFAQPAQQGSESNISAPVNARRGTLTLMLTNIGRYSDAQAIGEPFVNSSADILEAGALGDAVLGLAAVYCAQGRPLDAQQAFASARSIFQSTGHHVMIYGAVMRELRSLMLAYWPEQVEERWRLIALGDEAETRAREMLVPVVEVNRTPIGVFFLEGKWTEVRAIAEQAGVRTSLRNRAVIDSAYGSLARAQGDHKLAWDIVLQSIPQGPAMEPGRTFEGLQEPLQRLAIQLSLDADDLPGARAWLEGYDRWLEWSGSVLGQAESHLLWARFFHADGDSATARDRANGALRLASDPRQPLVLLGTHRFVGTLDAGSGRYSDAEDHFQHALAIAEMCSAPYEKALTLIAQAEARPLEKRMAEATALLDEAQEICTPLEAKPALARIEALRERLGSRRTQVSYPAGLTRREVEVLQLVAKGLTDAEVADQLFLSRRTVTSHLTSIYTKLNVSSRTAATRFAIEHDLG